MGIHLDWEIEAEQTQMHSAGEDPATARARRLARLRLLLLVAATLAVMGAIAAGVWLRLRAVEAEIEAALRGTVEAEVAALRIGDLSAFMALQRSATGDWLQQQEQQFNIYQALKVEYDVQLTGNVLGVAMDGPRGRVLVEEIINGIPYTRVWFYWRYDDGWRHVPPDYTFWGEVHEYVGEGVTVRYRTVDDPFAFAVGVRLEEWLRTGCAILLCENKPEIMVEVVPDDTLSPGWSVNNPWLLQVPSPYVWRARSDMPFDLDMQVSVATLLAERLVNMVTEDRQPVYPADAYYLRQAVISWLVERFTQVNTNSFLIRSLAQLYGEEHVGRLIRAMRPDSSVSVLSAITGTASLDMTGLDWRDFLTWRLAVEDELIAQRDEANFLTLYDTRDEAARNAAYARFNSAPTGERKVVVSAVVEAEADGISVLRAVAQVGDGGPQEEVIFRLVEGVWRRAN